MARVTATKSGETAISFKSPGKVPIRNIKASFTLKQEGSGDPSPSNIRLFTGATGTKWFWSNNNILEDNPSDSSNLSKTNNSYSNTDTYSGSMSLYVYLRAAGMNVGSSHIDNPPFDSNDYFAYRFNVPGSIYVKLIDEIRVEFKGSSKSFYIDFPVRLFQTGYHVLSFYINSNDFSTVGGFSFGHLQISLDDSLRQEYQEHKGFVREVNWESMAGTVYGGKLDLITGVLSVNFKKILGSSLTWAFNDSGYTFSDVHSSTLLDADDSDRFAMHVYSDHYKGVTMAARSTNAATTDNECTIHNSGHYISIKDSSLRQLSIEQVEETLANVEFCYRFSPALTYQLSPTQLHTFIGTNNIWSDADSIEVTYDLAESADMLKVRKQIMSEFKFVFDTTPKILQHGIYWNRTYGSTTENSDWAITKWYEFMPSGERNTKLVGNVGTDTTGITFQYYGEDAYAASYENG